MISARSVRKKQKLQAELLQLRRLFPKDFSPLPVAPLPALVTVHLCLKHPEEVRKTQLQLQERRPRQTPKKLRILKTELGLGMTVMTTPRLTQKKVIFHLSLEAKVQEAQAVMKPVVL